MENGKWVFLIAIVAFILFEYIRDYLRTLEEIQIIQKVGL